MDSSSLNLLKQISNTELLSQTHSLIQAERRIGTEILHRLEEIRQRELYIDLGYSSLFTFCVQELKYSEATAYRLINAVKVLAEFPEVDEKIRSGSLSVTTVSQFQSFCQAQKKENAIILKPSEKREILRAIEGQSKKETIKTLAALMPNKPLPPFRENERSQNEIKFVASERLITKLNRIKDLTADKKLSLSHAELIEMLADMALEKIESVKQEPLRADEVLSSAKGKPKGKLSRQISIKLRKVPSLTVVPPAELPFQKPSTAISAALRRKVWVRSQARCMHVAPSTGRRCQETRGLEIDHKTPWALGGSNDLENLRLLCKTHNLQTVQVAMKSKDPGKSRTGKNP